MYKTPRRKLGDAWICAEFGLHKIGEQAPYMSVTGEEWRTEWATGDRSLLACGCLHELVGEAFPELRPLIAWHLAADGAPMHYIANARFWHDMANGKRERKAYDPDPRTAFASTIHWGVIPETLSADQLLTLAWPACEHHLEQRREPMRKAFAEVVASIPEIARKLGAS